MRLLLSTAISLIALCAYFLIGNVLVVAQSPLPFETKEVLGMERLVDKEARVICYLSKGVHNRTISCVKF